jgi:haloacetate dehalogenase
MQAQLATATNDAQKEPTENTRCEDYRASASVDLKIDEADIKAGKNSVSAAEPVICCQSREPDLRQPRHMEEEGVNVIGKSIQGGHNLQKTAPKDTLAELRAFLG